MDTFVFGLQQYHYHLHRVVANSKIFAATHSNKYDLSENKWHWFVADESCGSFCFATYATMTTTADPLSKVPVKTERTPHSAEHDLSRNPEILAVGGVNIMLYSAVKAPGWFEKKNGKHTFDITLRHPTRL